MTTTKSKNAIRKIELDSPISVAGSTISTVSIRAPKVRDMLAVEDLTGSDVDKEIRMFSNLCEIPPESIHDMDMSDYTKLQKAYQNFLS